MRLREHDGTHMRRVTPDRSHELDLHTSPLGARSHDLARRDHRANKTAMILLLHLLSALLPMLARMHTNTPSARTMPRVSPRQAFHIRSHAEILKSPSEWLISIENWLDLSKHMLGGYQCGVLWSGSRAGLERS